ncbi:hypothetical protein DPMN_074871 [Dreissena polymorpha]|uniref:Uncharacterized protein n=1 Tax=Dreissena polymorpha TaxID=45954 RepID=A0A9D3YJF3_DREPO|nr:hypothetical protein DPMN_074871 [Dreissena polymorpha]
MSIFRNLNAKCDGQTDRRTLLSDVFDCLSGGPQYFHNNGDEVKKRTVNAGMGLSCLMVSGKAMRMQDMLLRVCLGLKTLKGGGCEGAATIVKRCVDSNVKSYSATFANIRKSVVIRRRLDKLDRHSFHEINAKSQAALTPGVPDC